MRIIKDPSQLSAEIRVQTARSIRDEWLRQAELSEQERQTLPLLTDEELTADFLSLIRFGTAGLRGLMRPGLLHMNTVTVALTTQALAETVRRAGGEQKGVVIAYDNRNHSERFARRAAEVLAGNGIRVFLFDALRPTPELSFALRRLGCQAGINITASHNTKEYNGYKVYWDDGAQMPPSEAAKVSEICFSLDIFRDIKATPFEQARANGQIRLIGEKIDEAYLRAVLSCSPRPEIIHENADRLKIVYTPLHGAGHLLVPRALRTAGFSCIYPVQKQMIPDGDFPTVQNPNPQFLSAFEAAIETARECGGDFIIATDPDADRMGCAVADSGGAFTVLTGNQIGLLLTDYIIGALKEKNRLPRNACVIKSIVSSELVRTVCRENGVALIDVYTGFKYIGEKIKEYEKTNEYTFLFGFEESYGYLGGTYARDKDAVYASVLIAETAAYHKSRGVSLPEALREIYKRYGYLGEYWDEIKMDAPDYRAVNEEVMRALRAAPPAAVAGTAVAQITDYQSGNIRCLETGKTEALRMASENMLSFTMADGSKIVIRPSGTEPKIKLYYFIAAPDEEKADALLSKYKAGFQRLVDKG